MSTQAVSKFLEQLANDPQLQNELSLEGKTKQERVATTVEIANKKGYSFTEAECVKVLDTVKKVQDGELDDAELEAVAGGADWGIQIAGALMRVSYWLFGDDDDDDDDEEGHDSGTSIAGVRG